MLFGRENRCIFVTNKKIVSYYFIEAPNVEYQTDGFSQVQGYIYAFP